MKQRTGIMLRSCRAFIQMCCIVWRYIVMQTPVQFYTSIYPTCLHQYCCIYAKLPKSQWSFSCFAALTNGLWWWYPQRCTVTKRFTSPDMGWCEHKSCFASQVVTFSRRMVQGGQVGAVISWSTAAKSVRTCLFKTFAWTHWPWIWKRKQQQPVMMIEIA